MTRHSSEAGWRVRVFSLPKIRPRMQTTWVGPVCPTGEADGREADEIPAYGCSAPIPCSARSCEASEFASS
jgi:hypothetical protein